MQKAKLRLLPNDRAVIELPEGTRQEQVQEWQDTFRKAWDDRDPIFLAQFEVIDQSQPDIESRLAAVEEWIRKRDPLAELTRLSEDLEGGYK